MDQIMHYELQHRQVVECSKILIYCTESEEEQILDLHYSDYSRPNDKACLQFTNWQYDMRLPPEQVVTQYLIKLGIQQPQNKQDKKWSIYVLENEKEI